MIKETRNDSMPAMCCMCLMYQERFEMELNCKYCEYGQVFIKKEKENDENEN